MAADSIAKLAVILTGDASPLSASLHKSLQDVDRWALGMARASQQAAASWNAGLARIAQANEMQRLSVAGGPMAAFDQSQLIPSSAFSALKEAVNPLDQINTKMRSFVTETDRLTSATLKMGMAMSAARGNMTAMVNLAISGGPTTWILAATAAAGALAFKLASISDAQRVATGSTDTWEHQFDRVQESAASIATTLGRPIANVLSRETEHIANILDGIASRILPEELRLEHQKVEILEKQKELIRSQADLKEHLVGLTKTEVGQFLTIEKERAALMAKAEVQGGKLLSINRERIASEMELARTTASGLLEAGNIDLTKRPRHRNADGSISTVRSMSTNIEGIETLIPTISKLGSLMSDAQAVDEFIRTGEHLGKFATAEQATAYAEQLHNQQEQFYAMSDADRLNRINAAQRELSLRGSIRQSEEEFGKKQEEAMDALRRKAESLREALRTPREEFVASLAEAGAMFEAGLLSAMNYERAAQAAKEKFLEASKIRDKAKEQAQQGIAAADRFTMAGFSAVQQGQRELQHIEQVAKEQLEEAKRQTEVEQEIAKILNDKLSNPIFLMEGTPP